MSGVIPGFLHPSVTQNLKDGNHNVYSLKIKPKGEGGVMRMHVSFCFLLYIYCALLLTIWFMSFQTLPN